MIADRSRIDRVKDGVLIGDVVGLLGGEVEPSFGDWQATRCPFHDDTVASAGTNNVVGKFVCHACGVRGDIIDLARLYLESKTGTGESVPLEKVLQWLEDLFLPER